MAAIKTLCLTSLFLIVSRISALQIGNDSKTACESSDVTIGFNFTIGNDSFADRSWYKNSVIPANKIARVVGAAGSLTVESQYIGRIALSGSGGIILYNVTKTDSGSYLFIIVTGTYFEDGTATTTVNVYVNPNASCMPKIEKNSADNFYCKISDACPGKDSIQAIWDDGSVGAFTCSSTTKNNHKCCAKGDQVNYCNSIGDLCTVIECPGSATTITSVDFITPSTIIPTDNIGSSSVLPTSVYVVASGTLTSTNNISFGNAVTSSSIMQTVSNSASVTLTDVVTHGTMRPIYNTGYSNVSVTLIFVGTPISTASIYNTDTVSQLSDQTQWWCKRDWCIGLGVASGGLLVFSFVIGIIIFSKKRKDLENHMCWQIWTISIVVVVVIIIAVTGVLAGIVCLNCWKEKK